MDTTPRRSDPVATPPVTPAVNPVSNAFSSIKAKRIQLDRLMASYDIRNISPRDIDAFVEEMLTHGQPLNADLLMLSSFGERFLDHLAEITGIAYNASVQVNMLDVAADQRGVAQRAGDTTENWDQFITFLTMIRDRTEAFLGEDANASHQNQE
ncbi:MAG: hypothetical protein ACRBB0_07665 [Pelagimonas sp.]|uniref:hypothetical protein n=1 Tax=Pelagimonas sp. TaxID=2073170 RepID=UPI003D6BD36E